ncbi:MAG: acetyltransferase [Prevotella sp.]|nr:acetyltransferase [Prevotella sp.]
MKNLIIVGLSATSRLAYSFVESHKLFNVIGFAVNEQYKECDSFCGLPVYTLENLKEQLEGGEFLVFVALLWNHLNADRRKVYEFCKSKGYEMANLISPLAVVRSEITGDNIWIHDYVVIQNDTRLGNNIAIMQGALIGADSDIASHCFFGAHSLFAGGCTIGEQSFVGLHATVFDDTHIGRKCIIGACTAVKRNMSDFSKYVTPSDNIVIKQYSEDEIENKLVFSKNVR